MSPCWWQPQNTNVTWLVILSDLLNRMTQTFPSAARSSVPCLGSRHITHDCIVSQEYFLRHKVTRCKDKECENNWWVPNNCDNCDKVTWHVTRYSVTLPCNKHVITSGQLGSIFRGDNSVLSRGPDLVSNCDFYHYLICNYRARVIQSLPFEQPDSPINWWFGLATTKSCLYRPKLQVRVRVFWWSRCSERCSSSSDKLTSISAGGIVASANIQTALFEDRLFQSAHWSFVPDERLSHPLTRCPRVSRAAESRDQWCRPGQ